MVEPHEQRTTQTITEIVEPNEQRATQTKRKCLFRHFESPHAIPEIRLRHWF